MKKLLKLSLALFLCVAAMASAQNAHGNPAGPAPVRNGLWWQEKSNLYREAFIAGYKAGSEHTAGRALDVNKFPGTVLIDGLDHFYKDFRNRSILIAEALTYVEDQLRGVPDDKLNAELLKMRAAAAPASVDEP